MPAGAASRAGRSGRGDPAPARVDELVHAVRHQPERDEGEQDRHRAGDESTDHRHEGTEEDEDGHAGGERHPEDAGDQPDAQGVDGGDDFTVKETGEGWRVRGEKPERWVRQTDFSNDEAVGYLADRLATLGVEKALAAAGAVPGDEVTIGEVSFEWQPTELEQFSSGMRGQDARFEDKSRAGADERRLQKDLRRAERMGLDKAALAAELEKTAGRREPIE